MIQSNSKIQHIFCSVFPSDNLSDYICLNNISNALLVIKHPMDWQEFGKGFVPISDYFMNIAQQNSISVYCVHAAHDNHSACSPSKGLANILPGNIKHTFRDSKKRIFGYSVDCKNPWTFKSFEAMVLAKVDLNMAQRYCINTNEKVERIAVVSGGGDVNEWLLEAQKYGCDTYITGILYFRGSTYAKTHNLEFIDSLKGSNLKALGLSHYISEKYGSAKLAKYLDQMFPIPAYFLPEKSKQEQLKTQWGLTIA